MARIGFFVGDAFKCAAGVCQHFLAQQGVGAAWVAGGQGGDEGVGAIGLGTAVSRSCFQACTIGAQPSAWMARHFGNAVGQPHLFAFHESL